ncbi:MAG: hypothetical protein NTX56_14990 [Proteobacteria bacterium]|nr:hypothetical protein [Pseudomonadota bacterium]
MRISHSAIFIAAVTCCLSAVAQANPAQEKLLAASEQQRQSILAAYLAKAGEKCSGVTKTFYQGSDHRGNVFWNATCAEDNSFVIQIFNNEINSIRVLDCKRLQEITGGTCFTKFKTPAS